MSGHHRPDPVYGASAGMRPLPFPAEERFPDVVRAGHGRTPWGARNGVPQSSRYTYRPGEAERDAEVKATLAALKAEAARRRAAKGDPR
jgi:hypothetical protein